MAGLGGNILYTPYSLHSLFKTSLKTLEEKLAVFLNQDSPESEASESNTEDDGIVDSEIKDV